MQPLQSSATEEHRTKRKFQPSITSYFALRDTFGEDEDQRGPDPTTRPRQHHYSRLAHNHHHNHRETLAPVLPGQVQADLLNVGMRVRKSVPEGYKTHKHKLSALSTVQTNLSAPASLEVKPPTDAVPLDFLHQRELLPFCGLHKVAGYAEQPTTNVHLYAGHDSHTQRANTINSNNNNHNSTMTTTTTTTTTNFFPLPAAAFTQPFSSQGSTASHRPANPSKRSWSEDDDKPLSNNFFFAIPMKGLTVDIDEVPVSPLSETPPQSINMLPQVRQYAQPKSRRRPVADEDIDMDFENGNQIEARLAAGSGSDFEEADFLAREMDMSGM